MDYCSSCKTYLDNCQVKPISQVGSFLFAGNSTGEWNIGGPCCLLAYSAYHSTRIIFGLSASLTVDGFFVHHTDLSPPAYLIS